MELNIKEKAIFKPIKQKHSLKLGNFKDILDDYLTRINKVLT